MNNVNLIGRITRDIEVKKTNSGKSVCSFTIAVQKDKENADFIPCTAWEGIAENIGKFFGKGDRIGITGVLSTRTFEDNGQKRFVMEVLVRGFDFLDSKTKKEATEKPAPAPAQQETPDADMPFEI